VVVNIERVYEAGDGGMHMRGCGCPPHISPVLTLAVSVRSDRNGVSAALSSAFDILA